LLQVANERLSQFEREGHLPLFVAFAPHGDQEVVQIDGRDWRVKQLVNPASSIEHGRNHGEDAPLPKSAWPHPQQRAQGGDVEGDYDPSRRF
jgi:hypothetical protein